MQVFVGNPRGWKLTAGDPAQTPRSPPAAPSAVFPYLIHTPYLVNVGSATEATVEASVATIAHNLARSAWLGCAGVVMHAGSAVGDDRYNAALRQLRERLLPVLDALPADAPRLLVEPTAGCSIRRGLGAGGSSATGYVLRRSALSLNRMHRLT